MAMHISNAIIDCWLNVSGTNYSDFQHHHWDIGPSGTIGTAVGNTLDYTWTLSGGGHDSSGSWNAISQSKTLSHGAQVRIINTNPAMVSLTQTVNFGVNNLQATGNIAAMTHMVPELTWPSNLTWSPSPAMSSIIYQDMGGPTYKLVPTFVPSGQAGLGEVIGLLTES